MGVEYLVRRGDAVIFRGCRVVPNSGNHAPEEAVFSATTHHAPEKAVSTVSSAIAHRAPEGAVSIASAPDPLGPFNVAPDPGPCCVMRNYGNRAPEETMSSASTNYALEEAALSVSAPDPPRPFNAVPVLTAPDPGPFDVVPNSRDCAVSTSPNPGPFNATPNFRDRAPKDAVSMASTAPGLRGFGADCKAVELSPFWICYGCSS